MTTTLRPAGPLQETGDGARSRPYEVRVNSRVVGTVELAADTPFGPSVGVIRGLWIDRPDRRRGRGTVAALAAEEVLRGWGCRRIQVAVPAEAVEALRMATALGYTEAGRNMAKKIAARPPALPRGAVGRPMTAGEYDAWLARAVAAYARTWAERGLPAAAAEAKSRADHAQNLPRGLETPGTTFTVLEHGGQPVGHVWTAAGPALPRGDSALPGGVTSYVFDVEVAEEHRGRGHGRTLMLLAERAAAGARSRLLGLQVFADNAPALGLYRSLGYRTVQFTLGKPLI
ncbi:GNAT family N-acetyltransferase [Streptomyces sp. NRRL S-87]|uniref:GNAT family N-acetyltransferase n=1 Tax=Streptomyces sp. NRRL S-87 TaxID=1463920 RepID=UPI0004C1104A|nr:GNAT family N-acetyltransferase [Streptomyces sp. NRRL S-87]